VEAVDPGNQLPPLDGTQVLLPYLDVPGTLQEFGDRRRAEPGVRYVHQVLKALRALSVWGEVEAVHVHKVLGQTEHADPRIRSQAFASLSQLPGELVPHEELLAMAEGPGPVEQRRLALMAFSHGSHPKVWLELHRIATDGKHECQGVALERLADLGNGFTITVLSEVDSTNLGFHGAVQARSTIARVEKRISGDSPAKQAQGFRQYVERAAWAEAADHPLRNRLADWTGKALNNVLSADELRGAVQDLRQDYTLSPGFGREEAQGVEQAVRRWLALLEEQARARLRK